LLARYDLAAAARTLTRDALAGRRGWGMWRFAELLPVRRWESVAFLGEGGQPLLAAPRLGREFGVRRLLVKAEGLNPTGSFKARGMAVAVARAVELGARALIAPSAGNAAGALAAYGSAAGVSVTVVMPVDAPAANQNEVRVCGARLLLVRGLIDDCGRIARLLAAASGSCDLSTLKEPYRVEGKKTMGLELVEQLGWRVPDVIVYPTGGGTGIIGMWKGFDELEALGLIGPARPRLISVQAEGCAPLVAAFDAGARHAVAWEHATTRASGIRVPGSVGDFLILDALRASGGAAISVSEDAISEAQLLAGGLGIGYVSPETGAAIAAVRALRESGLADAADEIVVFDTGIGHKYPAPPGLQTAPVVDGDSDEDPEFLLSELQDIGLIAARPAA
jgi:threonine synthase